MHVNIPFSATKSALYNSCWLEKTKLSRTTGILSGKKTWGTWDTSEFFRLAGICVQASTDLDRYKHRLTKARENLRVNECRGGLLADEMGMGKSLSVLTLIVHTLEAAQRFEARRFDDNGEVPTRQSSGATLIAAPKSSMCETLPLMPFGNADRAQLCRAGSLRLRGIDFCQSSHLGPANSTGIYSQTPWFCMFITGNTETVYRPV